MVAAGAGAAGAARGVADADGPGTRPPGPAADADSAAEGRFRVPASRTGRVAQIAVRATNAVIAILFRCAVQNQRASFRRKKTKAVLTNQDGLWVYCWV